MTYSEEYFTEARIWTVELFLFVNDTVKQELRKGSHPNLYSTTLVGDEHTVSVSFWYETLSQSKDSWQGHYVIIWISTIHIFLKVAVSD